MTTIAKLATKVQVATWRLEAAKLHAAAQLCVIVARKGDEERFRAALTEAQAAVERAFAALPERAT